MMEFERISVAWLIAAFVAMLVLSAFFSIAETAMMAINRYRLKHLVAQGDSAAQRVEDLLKRTDRLLGGILIGNTLTIVIATAISGVIASRWYGDDLLVSVAAPFIVGLLVIVFSEITPKVVGA